MKDRRTAINKLHTLLLGRDLRITKGEVFSDVYPFDFSSYYPEDNYICDMPVPKDNVYDIRSFGASCDSADNAPAINTAVALAAETGGSVLVSGGDYVTTTVYLRSGVTLFIERGSSLSSNLTGEGYDEKGIIHADGADDITLTGGGKIKGNGNYFGLKPLLSENMTEHPEIIDVIQMRRDYRAQLRFAHKSKYGATVYLKNCKNVKADNFIIENAAHWSLRLENCEGVNIKNFVINNNRNVANADGFDISGSSDVNIEHCFVSTADDGICIKNALWLGNRGEMYGIKIRDCEVISRTNAFKIGTETTFDISDVTVEDCRFMMTDLYPGTVSGIAIESADGSVISNITIRNIEMDRVTCPVFIRLCNRNRASKVNADTANAIEFAKKVKKASSAPADEFDSRGEIEHIIIENIVSRDCELPVILAGYSQKGKTKRPCDLTLKNIDMRYAPYKEVYDRRAFIPEYAEEYPESWRFRNLPAYGLWARHIRGLKLLDFSCTVPKSTWKQCIITEDII
jgi:polygalacturonase